VPDRDHDDIQYPLLTDVAGTVVVNPVNRVRLGVAILALAIFVGAGASAYVSTSLAGEKTDRHSVELMQELNRRTAERKANEKKTKDEQAYTAAVLEQNRRTMCELIPGVKPTSDVHAYKLDQLKHAYRCGTAKDALVPPGWSPPSGWPELPPGRTGFFPTARPSAGPSPSR